MATPLRILIVEDSETDAELLLRELRRGGYAPEFERVQTPEGLDDALDRQAWDLIVSDYAMPRFNGLQALKLTQEKGLDMPFIIVSGSIGEDVAVAAMKAGAHDYLMKGNTARLLPAIARELREARMRQERRQADETIHRLAYIDPVTGLPNRVRFREQVHQAIEETTKQHRPLALLHMNLEHFREVNDTLGHNRGDNLLHQVGMRLHSALFTTDVVARLGADEFGILLPQLAATDDVRHIIKKLQDCLEAPFTIDGIPIAVEASIGVATMPEHADDADTLLQRAGIAMYRAKQMASGYAVYVPEYDRRSPERLGLMAELRDAIEGGQLLLHFQPKVEIRTGHIVGTEALVRWQHPRHGLLPPDKFILAAEQTGLIGPLTRWVLIDALSHCQVARRQGIQLRVSVNLSARSLHDPRLPELVEEALKATGADPGQLTLEITESAIVLDPKRAEKTLVVLSRMGAWISIDDFGTGYTSLASIKHLSVNEVKIDKSFVLGMLTANSDAMIVRSVIDLGHNLGLRVVAEGVETQEMFDALAALGCDEAQGYFISKPQACEPLKSWFATSPWKIGPAG
ncbi:MAG TPA: EAL domain-containing protein [Acidiferrobacterales bacterium]|nr:EAL domain-containing protein [Acidiferrobacterales bacterium]